MIGVVSSEVSVILEQLAATGWFAEHGEIALTAGLTFCLEKDPAAAQSFVKLIRERTQLTEEDVPSPDRWQAESVDDNRARIDVAGWLERDSITAPVVFVEAKVSAIFGPRQVSTYVVSQRDGLARAGVAHGVLAVLVPEVRVRAAREEVAADLETLSTRALDRAWLVEGEPSVTVTVISWDEALDTMVANAEVAACDLEQLRGACRALRGSDVTALTEADLAGAWKSRKDDVGLVIDRVTREAAAELSLKPLPWVPNSSGGLEGGFRYLGASGFPCLAIGMRVDGASPPLWVRWHRETPDAPLAESRLIKAGHMVQKYEEHLWLPLDIAPDVGVATRQIESLVSQVVQLYKTAVDWTEPV